MAARHQEDDTLRYQEDGAVRVLESAIEGLQLDKSLTTLLTDTAHDAIVTTITTTVDT